MQANIFLKKWKKFLDICMRVYHQNGLYVCLFMIFKMTSAKITLWQISTVLITIIECKSKKKKNFFFFLLPITIKQFVIIWFHMNKISVKSKYWKRMYIFLALTWIEYEEILNTVFFNFDCKKTEKNDCLNGSLFCLFGNDIQNRISQSKKKKTRTIFFFCWISTMQ